MSKWMKMLNSGTDDMDQILNTGNLVQISMALDIIYQNMKINKRT